MSACLVFKLINLVYDYLQSCFSSLQYEHFKPFVFFPQVLQFIENPSVSYLDVFEYLYTKIIAAKIPTAAKTIHNNILLFSYTKIKSSVKKILVLRVFIKFFIIEHFSIIADDEDDLLWLLMRSATIWSIVNYWNNIFILINGIMRTLAIKNMS